ncbi:hypothetical protein BX616_005161 [Lobosporangium transversale]|nr:hypothetical protein BX616_005161 [Lobosporangium transversale]
MRELRIEDVNDGFMPADVWKAIRTEKTMLTALINGMKGAAERPELKCFRYTAKKLYADGRRLLGHILSMVSFKRLDLRMGLTCDQVVELFRSMDNPHVQHIVLQTEGWSKSNVQAVLDTLLQRFTKLQSIVLGGADITKEQEEQLHSKGITLDDELPSGHSIQNIKDLMGCVVVEVDS